ncbi:TPA: hypothetical protein ACU21S_001562 [Mannheimia haemolytica]
MNKEDAKLIKESFLSQLEKICKENNQEVDLTHLSAYTKIATVALRSYKNEGDKEKISRMLRNISDELEANELLIDIAIDGLKKHIEHHMEQTNKIISFLINASILDKEMAIQVANMVDKTNKITEIMKDFYLTIIEADKMVILDEVRLSPKVDRIKKGKIPKKKSEAELNAQALAKQKWKEDPSVSQNNMALSVIFELDLKQTTQTVIRWIKDLDPNKGKPPRKRKSGS